MSRRRSDDLLAALVMLVALPLLARSQRRADSVRSAAW
jgi:hypothetical protein